MTTPIPIPEFAAALLAVFMLGGVIMTWLFIIGPRWFIAANAILCVALIFLGGCALPPQPQPPTAASKPPVATSDPLAEALGRIGTRTAGQATGMGGREVSREVYTATGGSLAGQIGSAAARNTTSEIQKWWYGP